MKMTIKLYSGIDEDVNSVIAETVFYRVNANHLSDLAPDSQTVVML